MMPRETVTGEAPGRNTPALSRAIVLDFAEGRGTERQQESADTRLGALRSGRRFEVTCYRFRECSRSTTFPVPCRSEDIGLESDGFLRCELGVVALSAAANARSGDCAGDREGAARFPTGDGEGHLRTSSRVRNESASKRINLPERNTGILYRRMSSRK